MAKSAKKTSAGVRPQSGKRKQVTARATPKKRVAAPPRRRPARAAKPRREPREAAAPGVIPVELEPGSVEKTLAKLRQELSHWVNKGRYTKVRLRLRGKPVLPDIPIGALVAAEAMTFWWAGLLEALLVNVGAKALLDVELVSEADMEVARGKNALLSGDLDRACEIFARALEMDRDCASAYLNLGIAAKLRGDGERARNELERAEQLDPSGSTGEEARRLLDQLKKPAGQGPAPA